MKVIVEGIMGGTLPWGLLAVGVGIAAVLVVCRVPVMPFAIGLYLPIQMNAAIFAGGISRWILGRRSARRMEEGILFSAGLIAGEGLCGIGLAILMLVVGR